MADIDDKLLCAYQTLRLRVGDIYEDCFFHPVLCLGVDYQEDQIWGVSLIDGSQPRTCSLLQCGVRKLALEEAWRIKMRGPSDPNVAARISNHRRWWSDHPGRDDVMSRQLTVLPRKLIQ